MDFSFTPFVALQRIEPLPVDSMDRKTFGLGEVSAKEQGAGQSFTNSTKGGLFKIRSRSACSLLAIASQLVVFWSAGLQSVWAASLTVPRVVPAPPPALGEPSPQSTVQLSEFGPFESIGRTQSHRAHLKWGVYAGLLSEPAPSIWSINLAWNALEFVQLNAGYGQYSYYAMQVHGFHGGAKLFVPSWNISPYLGINAGTVFSNSKFVVQGQSIEPTGFPVVTTVKAGIEWYSASGFMLGAAYGIAISGPFAGTGTPGLYGGIFF